MSKPKAAPAAPTVMEKAFQTELLVAFGNVPGVTVWTQNVGTMVFFDPVARKRSVFKAGPPPGAADISGFVEPYGWRIEVECKSATGDRSPEQVTFAALATRGGAVYALAKYDAELDMAANVARGVALLEAAIAARLARGLLNTDPTGGAP